MPIDVLMGFHCAMLPICNHISSLGNALETIASSCLVEKTFLAVMLEQGHGTTNLRKGVSGKRGHEN